MKHLRSDYDAIQPWPTKRRHVVRQNGRNVEAPSKGWAGIDAEVQISLGAVGPIIPDDEPVFILRAQDALAPGLVRRWAIELANVDGDPELVAAALDYAEQMEAYAVTHVRKVPDVPRGVLP